MPMFVSDERVPVTIDGVNIVYVRPKMDFGTQQKVWGEMAKLRLTGGDGDNDLMANLGIYNLMLMRHNILGWEGPAFTGVPCIPRNIERLDPDEPLVEKVLEELNRRNTRADKDDAGDPKDEASGSATAGETPSEGSTKAPLEIMTSTSRSRSGSAGRGKK
jgi:hypothetical protein